MCVKCNWSRCPPCSWSCQPGCSHRPQLGVVLCQIYNKSRNGSSGAVRNLAVWTRNRAPEAHGPPRLTGRDTVNPAYSLRFLGCKLHMLAGSRASGFLPLPSASQLAVGPTRGTAAVQLPSQLHERKARGVPYHHRLNPLCHPPAVHARHLFRHQATPREMPFGPVCALPLIISSLLTHWLCACTLLPGMVCPFHVPW